MRYKYVFEVNGWRHQNAIRLEAAYRKQSVQFIECESALFCFSTFLPREKPPHRMLRYAPCTVIVE